MSCTTLVGEADAKGPARNTNKGGEEPRKRKFDKSLKKSLDNVQTSTGEKQDMDEITKLMNDMLTHLGKERWISFTKDDSPETFKARDKLRAFGLIEKYNEHSWRLTGEGYQALELGGFEHWKKVQSIETPTSIEIDNLSIVTGDKNSVNQSSQENSPKTQANQAPKSGQETKRTG